MKKLLVVLLLVVCAAWVCDAYAGVIAGNNTKLFWRDSFGDPNDSYVEASPGDVVFAQVDVNNNQWSAVRNTGMNTWWDGGVVDSPSVLQEFAPYAHLKDYRNGGGFEDWSAPVGDTLSLSFGGSNVYIYSGPGGAGAPYPTGFDYMGTYGDDPGGLLLGYYIPIRADAPLGPTVFSVQVYGVAAWGSYWAWVEELSDETNTDWALTINVTAGGQPDVPEPITLTLLLGGVGVLVRRRK